MKNKCFTIKNGKIISNSELDCLYKSIEQYKKKNKTLSNQINLLTTNLGETHEQYKDIPVNSLSVKSLSITNYLDNDLNTLDIKVDNTLFWTQGLQDYSNPNFTINAAYCSTNFTVLTPIALQQIINTWFDMSATAKQTQISYKDVYKNWKSGKFGSKLNDWNKINENPIITEDNICLTNCIIEVVNGINPKLFNDVYFPIQLMSEEAQFQGSNSINYIPINIDTILSGGLDITIPTGSFHGPTFVPGGYSLNQAYGCGGLICSTWSLSQILYSLLFDSEQVITRDTLETIILNNTDNIDKLTTALNNNLDYDNTTYNRYFPSLGIFIDNNYLPFLNTYMFNTINNDQPFFTNGYSPNYNIINNPKFFNGSSYACGIFPNLYAAEGATDDFTYGALGSFLGFNPIIYSKIDEAIELYNKNNVDDNWGISSEQYNDWINKNIYKKYLKYGTISGHPGETYGCQSNMMGGVLKKKHSDTDTDSSLIFSITSNINIEGKIDSGLNGNRYLDPTLYSQLLFKLILETYTDFSSVYPEYPPTVGKPNDKTAWPNSWPYYYNWTKQTDTQFTQNQYINDSSNLGVPPPLVIPNLPTQTTFLSPSAKYSQFLETLKNLSKPEQIRRKMNYILRAMFSQIAHDTNISNDRCNFRLGCLQLSYSYTIGDSIKSDQTDYLSSTFSIAPPSCSRNKVRNYNTFNIENELLDSIESSSITKNLNNMIFAYNFDPRFTDEVTLSIVFGYFKNSPSTTDTSDIQNKFYVLESTDQIQNKLLSSISTDGAYSPPVSYPIVSNSTYKGGFTLPWGSCGSKMISSLNALLDRYFFKPALQSLLGMRGVTDNGVLKFIDANSTATFKNIFNDIPNNNLPLVSDNSLDAWNNSRTSTAAQEQIAYKDLFLTLPNSNQFIYGSLDPLFDNSSNSGSRNFGNISIMHLIYFIALFSDFDGGYGEKTLVMYNYDEKKYFNTKNMSPFQWLSLSTVVDKTSTLSTNINTPSKIKTFVPAKFLIKK